MEITRELIKTISGMCLGEKDAAEMVAELEPLAESGDQNAQHALGLIYYLGIAEDTDFDSATKWLKKAASQGNVESQQYLSLIYIQLDNYDEAYVWTSLAAENGNKQAQLNLSVMYFNGSGIDKDIDKAIKLATLAAEQGDAQAQCNLAKMYLASEDESIYEDAIKWLQLSSEQENAEAQCKLGLMYENGQGTEKNYCEAFRLYSLSANQGFADAQYCLGQLLENGLGVDQNCQEAYKWYVLAAEQGDEEAKERIIDIESINPELKQGASMINTDSNAEEITIKLLKDASEKGIAQSQYLLGVAYLTGTGVDLDYNIAQELLISAAEQNHSNAQYNLGVIHANGLGVESDLDKAYQWFKRSAMLGNDDAIEAINQLIGGGYEIDEDDFHEIEPSIDDDNLFESDEDQVDDDESEEEEDSENQVDLSDHDEFFMYQEELNLDQSNFRLRYKFLQYLMEVVNSHYSDDRDNMLDLYISELEDNLNYIIDKATPKDKLMNFMKLNCLMQLGTLKVIKGNFFEAVKSYYKVLEYKWKYNKRLILLSDNDAPEELKIIFYYAAYNIHSLATRLGVGYTTVNLYSLCNKAIEKDVTQTIDYYEKRNNDDDTESSKSVYQRTMAECSALRTPGSSIVNFYFYESDDLSYIYEEDPDDSEYDYFNTTKYTFLIDDDIVNGKFSAIHNPQNIDDQISRLRIYL